MNRVVVNASYLLDGPQIILYHEMNAEYFTLYKKEWMAAVIYSSCHWWWHDEIILIYAIFDYIWMFKTYYYSYFISSMSMCLTHVIILKLLKNANRQMVGTVLLWHCLFTVDTAVDITTTPNVYELILRSIPRSLDKLDPNKLDIRNSRRAL